MKACEEPATKALRANANTRYRFAKLWMRARLASLSQCAGYGCEFNRFMSVLGIGVDLSSACASAFRDRFEDRFLHRYLRMVRLNIRFDENIRRGTGCALRGKEAVSKAFARE